MEYCQRIHLVNELCRETQILMESHESDPHEPDHDDLYHSHKHFRVFPKGLFKGFDGELHDIGVLLSSGLHRLIWLRMPRQHITKGQEGYDRLSW